MYQGDDTVPVVDQVALGIRIFSSVSDRNHSVPGISYKSFLYPIGTYEISVDQNSRMDHMDQKKSDLTLTFFFFILY